MGFHHIAQAGIESFSVNIKHSDMKFEDFGGTNNANSDLLLERIKFY